LKNAEVKIEIAISLLTSMLQLQTSWTVFFRVYSV